MTMTIMKRQRDHENENEEKESMDLITSLMLLSKPPQNKDLDSLQSIKHVFSTPPLVEFECKTCNRKFSSFQALGGHRASHKKPKLEGEALMVKSEIKSKPKVHECSICGQEFALGQALGGHMRRHRINNEGFSSSIKHVIATKAPVLKRSNSSKRIMCLQMDLNLTPLENDLKLLFGNKAPQVDLSLF